MTINCVLDVLVDESREGILPENIYIQLDNCSRENKNKYFIASMALLVARDVVRTVQMNFLMVGHTHEGMYSI